MLQRFFALLCISTTLIFADNYHVYPGKNRETTIVLHGFGGDYTTAEKIRSCLDDTLISFDFPDARVIEGKTDLTKCTFGSLEELKPAAAVLKKAVIEEKRNKINLYGYSAGGAATVNILVALYTDRDIGLTYAEKKQILEAIQKGMVILDVPLKSVEEVIDFRGTTPEREILAQRYRENGMRPIDAVEKLRGLPLTIVVHFQIPDEVISNKDDQLFISRLKTTNLGRTYAIIGRGEGHNGYHSALWKFYKERVVITASLETSLADEPIAIEVTGLNPLEEIELIAQMQGDEGETWRSSAVYLADAAGTVDLRKQASIRGSYVGVDPMGLFWSMKTQKPKTFASKKDQIDIQLSALRNGNIVARQEISRLLVSSDVKRIEVKENGIAGVLFLPESEKPLPTIISLSGTQRAISEPCAKLLASHGFAVFAQELPPNLETIPLEYFEQSIAYLKKNPLIGSIGIYGVSRGAELSLILGTIFPKSVQAIAASSPSSAIYSAAPKKQAAWTFRGRPVGSSLMIEEEKTKSDEGKTPDSPISTTPVFLKGMQDKRSFEKAIIPVEKIQCPLLLISGGDDRMWPSTLFARQIKERLKGKNSKVRCTHLDYARAGHQINIPYLPSSSLYFHPTASLWFTMGGSPQEDDHAARDSWEQLITFFKTHLKS